MRFCDENYEYLHSLFSNKQELDMFKRYIENKGSLFEINNISNFVKNYNEFEHLIKLYTKYIEDTDINILKIKLHTSDDIDVLQISELLKNLNTINQEIAELLGFSSEKVVFKLKCIKKGCIELSIIHGIIGAATEVIATPIIKGLIGRKNLVLLENNTELLKEAFINFLTSKSKKINSYATKNAINAKKEFFKSINSIKDIQAIDIKNNRKSKKIMKDNFIDYYV